MTRPAILDVLREALEISAELDAFGLDPADIERATNEYNAAVNTDPEGVHQRADRGSLLINLVSFNEHDDIEARAADAIAEILHAVRLETGDERYALLKGYEYFTEEARR